MNFNPKQAELYGSDQTNGNPDGAKRLGGFVVGSFTPLSGAAFGPGRNNVALSGNTQVTNADPNTNGAVFMPASGFRNTGDGAVYYIGFWGGSWSATTSTSDYGHNFEFNSTYIRPQDSNLRSHGFPVRCIRD